MGTNQLRIGWQRRTVDLPTRNRRSTEDADNPLAALRICLVSSNPFACRTIKQILQSVGIWGVAEQRSFKAAELALEERRFDLLIIDVSAADAAALDFIAQVRGAMDGAVSRLPIVTVMDGGEAAVITKIRDHGVNAILLRPFSPKGLMMRIRKALDRSQAFIRSAAYVGPCRRAPNRRGECVGPDRRAA